MTTANFKRENKSNNFKGEAGYGFCVSKSETYYSFKGHLFVDGAGNIANFTLTEASGRKREAVLELIGNKNSTFLLGDKGYLSARFKSVLVKRHKTPLLWTAQTQFDSNHRLMYEA